MAKQAITFVVDPDRDRDILRWLDGCPNKSAAIREAIRASFKIKKGDTSLEDIYHAIQELKTGAWLPASQVREHESDDEEPADLASALDSLGL